jgi:hypothetical protein
MRFSATISLAGKTASGFVVPAEVVTTSAKVGSRQSQ